MEEEKDLPRSNRKDIINKVSSTTTHAFDTSGLDMLHLHITRFHQGGVFLANFLLCHPGQRHFTWAMTGNVSVEDCVFMYFVSEPTSRVQFYVVLFVYIEL